MSSEVTEELIRMSKDPNKVVVFINNNPIPGKDYGDAILMA